MHQNNSHYYHIMHKQIENMEEDRLHRLGLYSEIEARNNSQLGGFAAGVGAIAILACTGGLGAPFASSLLMGAVGVGKIAGYMGTKTRK